MNNNCVCKVLVANKDNNQILLIRRSLTDTRRPGQWDLPGGGQEDYETLEDAAVREVQEEVGLTIVPNDLKLSYTISEPFNSASIELTHWLFFLCQVVNPQIRLSFEHSKFLFTDLDSAINLVEYSRHQRFLRAVKL